MSGDPFSPFALPPQLPADLAQVLEYWQHLKRGENTIPFADDLNLSSIGEFADNLFLLDVFANPPRCRFSEVGRVIATHYGSDISGAFGDEINGREPLNYLSAQFSATLEDRSPTFYLRAGNGKSNGFGYSRIMLPLWGGGQINTILTAITASN